MYGSRQHQSKLGTGRPLDHRQPATKVHRAWLGGFTLLELLVTIAILGLTASLAIPALRDFVLNHRAVGWINQFVAAVNFARSEAVTRGASVTLCSSTEPQAAHPTYDSQGRWEQGWILFVDHDWDARPDVGSGACLAGEDCLLQAWDGWDERHAMTFSAHDLLCRVYPDHLR